MSLELQIETTSTCQAACRFCPYPALGRWGGLMAMPLFRRIIDDAATIPQITAFVLHGLGEPALDPHLLSRILYIRGKGLQQTIEIYTNGIAMTPERLDALKAAGLTAIVFSLNAVRPEQHEAVMGVKGKFDMVCRHIDHALGLGILVEVHAVSNDDDFTEADRVAFYTRWGSVFDGGHGNCIREMNWAGLNRDTFQWERNACCQRAVGQIYVLYDGRVSMCCLDPTGKTTFGDLKTQTIRGVYNSDYYTMFRALHSSDKAAVFKACRGCTRT